MKKKWYRIANGALSALLVMLGFEACSENGMCEYGTPTVDYHVTGQVTDADGQPVEGIRVTTRGYRNFINGATEHVTFTDKDGRYRSEDIQEVSLPSELRIVFEDVDGDEHGGLFETDSVVSADMSKRRVKKGDGSWYDGEFELTADKRLKLRSDF